MTQRRPLVIGSANLHAELTSGDDAYFPGDVRTRVGNTGGGDFYGRHLFLSPAGYMYWTDPSGTEYARMGSNSSPGTDLAIRIAGTTDALIIDNGAAGDPARVEIPISKHAGRINLAQGYRGGTTLAVGAETQPSIVQGTWEITGWKLIIDVTSGGVFRLEVSKVTYASYTGAAASSSMSGVSTSTGGCPRITVGTVKNTSTDVSLWTSTIVNDGDIIQAAVTANGATAGFFCLQLFGKKVERY